MALDLVLAATGVGEPPTFWLRVHAMSESLLEHSLMLPSEPSLSVPDGILRELQR